MSTPTPFRWATGQAGDLGFPPAGLYRLDPMHAFAQFSVKHLVVGRVDGRFNALEGVFEVLDDSERLFGRIEVRIDAASVDTNVEARDEDLRGPRFFDVATFADLTFVGVDGQHKTENIWTVTGDLTIRDVSRRVALEVIVRGATLDLSGNTRIGLSARTAHDRAPAGVRAGTGPRRRSPGRRRGRARVVQCMSVERWPGR